MPFDSFLNVFEIITLRNLYQILKLGTVYVLLMSKS